VKVASWLGALTDVFLPGTCVACDVVLSENQVVFCEACFVECNELRFPRCIQCAEPGEFRLKRCDRCLRNHPSYETVFAVFEYEGAVEKAIHRLKYSDRSDISKPLGTLLAKSFEHAEEFRALDVLVPIPLHESRFRERKYDHAALLTTAISGVLRVSAQIDGVVRLKSTVQQVGLSEAQRAQNVSGAFVGNGSFAGLHVGLIDDVVTTGATANEVASVLKRAGAKSVTVLCVARQPRQL
jgi:ComF family protein